MGIGTRRLQELIGDCPGFSYGREVDYGSEGLEFVEFEGEGVVWGESEGSWWSWRS